MLIDRVLDEGPSTGTVICPVGTASPIVSQAWVSVRAEGGAHGTVWFRKSAPDSDDPPPDSGPALAVKTRSAQRAHAPIPTGTEFLQYDLTCDGPGALSVEMIAATDTSAGSLRPTGLHATADPDRRVTLTWAPVPNAQRYKIYELQSPNGVPNGEPTDPRSVRGPLSPGAYTYWVTAFVDGVETPPSERATATVGEQPGGGGQPGPGGPAPGTIVPATAKLVATLDYATGDLGQWSTLQTHDRNGSAGGYATYSASVRNGGPGHETAARFEVRKGDVPNFGGGERSEVRAGSSTDVRDGDERWYVWSMRFGDTDFRPSGGGWCIVMQWHAGNGSPPLCLECNPNGQLEINNNRPGGYSKAVASIDAGHWHEYVLHARFSRNASKGLVELWRDGKKLAGYSAATMASDHNYLKQGLYRSSQPFAQVIWHDSLRIYRP